MNSRQLKTYLLVIIGLSFYGSDLISQDIQELERRMGFKDIKLGADISTIEGAEFKKEFKNKEDVSAKLYRVVHKNYESIGDIKVRSLELNVYRHKIYEIVVVTDKDPRLMKSLEEAFGRAEYNVRSDSYIWLAESLSLSFTSRSKKELEMVYRSASVIKQMKEDKRKDIKKLSSDF